MVVLCPFQRFTNQFSAHFGSYHIRPAGLWLTGLQVYEGDPDCCAPTCPAKCTNKRRSECSAGGVRECDGIPGCCPELFDVVFGAGVFLDDGED